MTVADAGMASGGPGTEDRILPDVGKRLSEVAARLPQATVTPLQGCGHFLQEDRPDEVGDLLARFFAERTDSA